VYIQGGVQVYIPGWYASLPYYPGWYASLPYYPGIHYLYTLGIPPYVPVCTFNIACTLVHAGVSEKRLWAQEGRFTLGERP